MNASLELLDRYKKAKGIAADNAAAEALGITRATVSGWRHEKSHPDAESVARMCETTGENVAHWLPLIEAARARTPEARKVWLRLAQMAAAVALTVGLYPAHAETAMPSGHVAQSAHVYTMRNQGCDGGVDETPPSAPLVHLAGRFSRAVAVLLIRSPVPLIVSCPLIRSSFDTRLLVVGAR